MLIAVLFFRARLFEFWHHEFNRAKCGSGRNGCGSVAGREDNCLLNRFREEGWRDCISPESQTKWRKPRYETKRHEGRAGVR